MNIVASQAGIDVSKDELVTSIDQAKTFTVPNHEEGAKRIALALPEGCTVHLESSGGYERTAARVLRAAGFRVQVHNPLKARRLAQGTGRKAKTDPIDARMLSRSGHLLPASQPKSQERQGLCDLSRAIDALKGTAASYKKKMSAPELDEEAKKAYSALVKGLQGQLRKLEGQFVRRVKASSFKERYELALSVPCVGPVAARVCVCELPEDLYEQPASHMSSYAGLAPIDNSSGKHKGPSRIGRGNARLKKGFYMAGVCALRFQPWAKALYARLMARGKVHDQAMVAVMRRMLLRVVCVLQRGSSWQDEPPKA